MSRVFALRGAVCAESDTREAIVDATQRLISRVLEVNQIQHEDIISMVFTSTADLTTEFPAAAARLAGLDVPLLCARELEVSSSIAMPRCIRLLMHLYADERPQPVYLGDTERLREAPDPL